MPYQFNVYKEILILANALKMFEGENMFLHKEETLNLR